jgi:hypothetical protein
VSQLDVCRNGHARTPENTFTRCDGYTGCLACRRVTNRDHGWKRQERMKKERATEDYSLPVNLRLVVEELADPTVGWQRDAACRTFGPSRFYPTHGDKGATGRRAVAEVCAECPVRYPCLVAGLYDEEGGIWGGTLDRRRRRVRQQLKGRVDGIAV